MQKNPKETDFMHYRLAQMDDLEWIQFRRKEISEELARSKSRIHVGYQRLTGKEEKIPTDKWGKTAYLLSRGGTIINGLRIGLKVGRAINTLIGLKWAISRKK